MVDHGTHFFLAAHLCMNSEVNVGHCFPHWQTALRTKLTVNFTLIRDTYPLHRGISTPLF
jgi:hypothetical protein